MHLTTAFLAEGLALALRVLEIVADCLALAVIDHHLVTIICAVDRLDLGLPEYLKAVLQVATVVIDERVVPLRGLTLIQQIVQQGIAVALVVVGDFAQRWVQFPDLIDWRIGIRLLLRRVPHELVAE